MDNIIHRDPQQLTRFACALLHFCDRMERSAIILAQQCDQAEHAMQDSSSRPVVKRLTDLSQDIRAQVSDARDLADRIARSAALLEESEQEV